MGFADATAGIGSIVGIGADIYGQNKANRDSKEMAQKQMDFQERMSSSAHQREVKDLRAAGLNPMLGYMQSGASTPSGAMGSVKSPEVGGQVRDAGRLFLDKQEQQARINQINATAEKTNQEKENASILNGILRAQEWSAQSRKNIWSNILDLFGGSEGAQGNIGQVFKNLGEEMKYQKGKFDSGPLKKGLYGEGAPTIFQTLTDIGWKGKSGDKKR
jgi:hypothetical protein